MILFSQSWDSQCITGHLSTGREVDKVSRESHNGSHRILFGACLPNGRTDAGHSHKRVIFFSNNNHSLNITHLSSMMWDNKSNSTLLDLRERILIAYCSGSRWSGFNATFLYQTWNTDSCYNVICAPQPRKQRDNNKWKKTHTDYPVSASTFVWHRKIVLQLYSYFAVLQLWCSLP